MKQTLTEADTDSMDKETHCPYWRCQQRQTFKWHVDPLGGPRVAQEWCCENCGRSYQWAMNENERNDKSDYNAELKAWRS